MIFKLLWLSALRTNSTAVLGCYVALSQGLPEPAWVGFHDLVHSAIRSSPVRGEISQPIRWGRIKLVFGQVPNPGPIALPVEITDGSSGIFTWSTPAACRHQGSFRPPQGKEGRRGSLRGNLGTFWFPLRAWVEAYPAALCPAGREAASPLCHMITPSRRMPATTATFLCWGLRRATRS